MNVSEAGINIEKDVNIHLENKKMSRHFFLFIWIMYAVVCMTKNCYNGALASIVAEGVLTKSQTGFITGMFYLVYAPFQILGGLVSDRVSPEKMIKIGLVGAVVANTIIFFNQNYYVMLITWVLNGVVQFGIWPSAFKIVSSQLVRSDRTQMTFYITFSSTGGLLLSYIIAAVVPKWQYNFAISAIALLIFAVVLHIYEKHLNPYMKWDKGEKEKKDENSETKIPTMKILAASGFFFVLISTILSITVSQSRATLAPVMFVENYESISPSLGNIMNTVLIISGLMGTIIAKRFIKKVKNEIFAIILGLLAMVPFLLVCYFVGTLPIWVMVVALCVVAALESIVALFKSYYNMHFVRYGKSGTAAGIMNAGNAFAYMLAAYVMPRIVELFGWHVQIALWPVLIVVSALAICLALRKFKKFVEMIF